MNTKLIGIVGVGLVLLAGAVGAFVTGVGPVPGGSDNSGDGAQTTYADTVVVEKTGSNSDGSSGGSGSSGSAESTPPFTFTIKKIEECGNTCRKVTGSITNNQNETATGVVVRSEIYTDGDKIWEGKSELGTMEPDETVSDTKTVKLSYGEAYKVKQNDGKILVKTYVITDETTYVFKEQRDVA